MRICKRFHIEDVEPGDAIMLHDEDKEPIVITVWRTFRTNRFGWGIEATDHSEYYWDDWDWAEFIS